MAIEIELKPEVEARAVEEAKARAVSVEEYLASIIEGSMSDGARDERFRMMEDAVRDKLFLADLAETMEDFKHADQD